MLPLVNTMLLVANNVPVVIFCTLNVEDVILFVLKFVDSTEPVEMLTDDKLTTLADVIDVVNRLLLLA